MRLGEERGTAPRDLQVVFLTGMSGSGRTTAAKALEDLSFFCVDNLPVLLVPKLLDLCATSSEVRRAALVVDVREGEFLRALPDTIHALKEEGYPVFLLFLTASDEALVRRFQQSRRRPPLSRGGTIEEGIAREREALRELQALADRVIDTSAMSVHDLRRELQTSFRGLPEGRGIAVTLESFGYTFGIVGEADLLVDVRFLPNPYFVEELRPLAGTDPKVRTFVLESEGCGEFLEKVQGLVGFLTPRFEREGRSHLTIGIGCTGGRHRSVAIAEELGERLRRGRVRVRVVHRDAERWIPAPAAG